jgi:hypothetical protein
MEDNSNNENLKPVANQETTKGNRMIYVMPSASLRLVMNNLYTNWLSLGQ